MIVAIEGLIPDRRLSPAGTQPAAPPVGADIDSSAWRRKQEHQAPGEEPTGPAATTETQPTAPHVLEPTSEPAPKLARKLTNDASSPNLDRNQPSVFNPFINPGSLNRVPAATDLAFDAVLDTACPLRLSLSPQTGFSGRRR